MKRKRSPQAGPSAGLLALFCCFFAGTLLGQQKHYQEAHVYITAPGTASAPAPVSPAVEVVRPMLLSDRGFQTFEPLEQPNEHVPSIIIDENKTFQTIIGFGAAFTDAASTTFGKPPRDSRRNS